MTEDTIIYEQPLNEIIRACLRIEQLFLQADHLMNDNTYFGTRNIIAVIINLLQLVERPDLKAKLAKELINQTVTLSRLESTPEIDHEKLQATIRELNKLASSLIDNNQKIAQNLRQVELLNSLRLHLASPGGGLSFDIPIYHYWLNLSLEERNNTINSWLSEFNQIRNSISIMLKLIRESSKFIKKTAENGFYQEPLDPQANLPMVRVAIQSKSSVYPEISVGRHYLSVRYFTPSINNRPVQFSNNLDFWISHCSV